jgi:hypothetical protein
VRNSALNARKLHDARFKVLGLVRGIIRLTVRGEKKISRQTTDVGFLDFERVVKRKKDRAAEEEEKEGGDE